MEILKCLKYCIHTTDNHYHYTALKNHKYLFQNGELRERAIRARIAELYFQYDGLINAVHRNYKRNFNVEKVRT